MGSAELKPRHAAAALLASLILGGASLSSAAAEAASPDAQGMEARVNVRVKDAPLASFLDSLAEQARVSFVLAEGLEKRRVTAAFQDVTAREALDALCAAHGLDARKAPGGGIYIIAPRQDEPGGAAGGAPDPLKTRVTVQVKGAPLAAFLDSVSEQAKVNFIIKEGLEARRVTLFLNNVTVEEALDVVADLKDVVIRRIKRTNNFVVEARPRPQ